MCFLSVDLRLQMLMESSLLAIVSLMVFQIFEALYINCELGSGVIREMCYPCMLTGSQEEQDIAHEAMKLETVDQALTVCQYIVVLQRQVSSETIPGRANKVLHASS